MSPATALVHEAADTLRDTLRAHGLDVPGLSVEQDRISLGDIAMP
ncbi:hypothetical protein ACFQ7N_23305 [Streptomyces niveus]